MISFFLLRVHSINFRSLQSFAKAFNRSWDTLTHQPTQFRFIHPCVFLSLWVRGAKWFRHLFFLPDAFSALAFFGLWGGVSSLGEGTFSGFSRSFRFGASSTRFFFLSFASRNSPNSNATRIHMKYGNQSFVIYFAKVAINVDDTIPNPMTLITVMLATKVGSVSGFDDI